MPFFFLSMFHMMAHAEEQAIVSTTAESITIDGQLSEPAWSNATPITNFIQYLPTEGGLPSGKTEVRFLQDEKHLYIGIHVSNTDYKPQATITPREQINDDDQVGVYIDTVGDARTGYILYFNPHGIQQDIRYSNGSWFVEWNTVYHSKGTTRDDGYTVEISIPFRSLRYPETENPDWRIMLTRKNPAKGSKYAWPKLKRRHPRMFMQAKPLQGVKPPPTGAGIWLQPSLSALYNMEDQDGELQPVADQEWHDQIRPSFDLRWGLNSDTNLAMTINPDFSQIEGDVRQLNLNQRFAFFYPERRPFFLNNIGIFSDIPSTLYSRSIVDPIYGVKLSGRQGKIDFGVLQALDRSPNSSVHEKGTTGFNSDDIEDTLAFNNIIRMRHDVGKQGFVGVTLADKRMLSTDFSPTSAFSDVLNLELSYPFAQTWVGSVYSSSSYAGTSDAPMLGNQTAISLSSRPAQGLGGNINLLNSTTDYRQEMGFVTRSGYYKASGGLNYGIPLENRSFASSSLSGSFWQEEEGNMFAQGSLEQNIRLQGIHKFELSYSPNFIRFSDAENLGYRLRGSWESRFSANIRSDVSVSHGNTIDYSTLSSADYTDISGNIVVRPTQQINFSSTLNFNIFTPKDTETEHAFNTYNRLIWQLSRDWGLRLVHQSTVYSAQETQHNGSILLTWLTTPGTEAYIGSTWSLTEENLDNVTFFAKFTRLFRL